MEDNNNQKIIEEFHKYFVISPYECFIFNSTVQKPNESFDSYVIHLWYKSLLGSKKLLEKKKGSKLLLKASTWQN